MKIYGRKAPLIILAIFTLICLGWLITLDFEQKVSTQVLDLIPEDETAPEWLIAQEYMGQEKARIMLAVIEHPEASERIIGDLRARISIVLTSSDIVDTFMFVGDAKNYSEIGRFVFEQRLPLLLPNLIESKHQQITKSSDATLNAKNLAQAVVADLDAFLAEPAGAFLDELLEQDPLLLTVEAMEQFQSTMPNEQNVNKRSLLWLKINHSPFEAEGQGPVFKLMQQLEKEAKSILPNASLLYTGVNVFAHNSEAHIKREVVVLNALTLSIVLFAAFALCRNFSLLIHVGMVLALSILGAWTLTTFFFERVHIFALVVGAILSGIAVDYCFHIFISNKGNLDPVARLKRLSKPLMVGCVSTACGFAALMFSELSIVQQIGFFVASGLLCAGGVAALYSLFVQSSFVRGEQPRAFFSKGNIAWVYWGVVVVGIFGISYISWKDDIRILDYPLPELIEQDAQVRAAFGEGKERAVFISYGKDRFEAKEALLAFEASVTKVGAQFQSFTLGMQSQEAIELTENFIETEGVDFVRELKLELARYGFEVTAFKEFFIELEQFIGQKDFTGSYVNAYGQLLALLKGPASMLYGENRGVAWFISHVDGIPADFVLKQTQTQPLEQIATLNKLFQRYRQSLMQMSFIGLLIMSIAIVIAYGFRNGLWIMAVPIGSALGVLGLLGWFVQELSFFHLVGCFLGVCLALDYAVFTVQAKQQEQEVPYSILVSAVTTSLSFGVLGLSEIEAIRSLGIAVLLTVCLGACGVYLFLARIRFPQRVH